MRYLIYDDECNFCCSIIEKLTPLVCKSTITFIALKSSKGQKFVDDFRLHNINSVIYINNKDEVYIKAIAILHVLRAMRSPYNLMYLLKIFPTAFLNFIYDFIAKHRMQIK